MGNIFDSTKERDDGMEEAKEREESFVGEDIKEYIYYTSDGNAEIRHNSYENNFNIDPALNNGGNFSSSFPQYLHPLPFCQDGRV